MTPAMRAALLAANPHGLARTASGWHACGPGGGYSTATPCHRPGTIAALVDRGNLTARYGTARLTDRGRAALTDLQATALSPKNHGDLSA